MSVWFISSINGCYESDDISLKGIRSGIPSGSFVIFFTLTPRCFSIRFLFRSRARRAPLWMRMQMHNFIVIQSYLHSCTTRCDVMWCHNVMYNTEIIKILTLRVQIALSLRQDLNIIVSLASVGKPNMILYNPIFVLCMQ